MKDYEAESIKAQPLCYKLNSGKGKASTVKALMSLAL